MGFKILTNVPSLVAQTNLTVMQKRLTTALERLSSGAKINHAADDPAGYLMAIQFQFQIDGVEKGTYNMSMAVDALNTADSYLQVINTDLTRMSELAYLAKNALMTTEQRQTYQFEFAELISEIDRLTLNATYNGKVLLNGCLQGVTIQVGVSNLDVVTMSVNCLTVGASGLNITSLGISTIALADSAIIRLNSAVVATLAPALAALGAQAAGWSKSIEAQERYATNLKSAKSRVYDADLAAETTNMINAQVLVQSGIAALAQANAAATMAMGILGGGG